MRGRKPRVEGVGDPEDEGGVVHLSSGAAKARLKPCCPRGSVRGSGSTRVLPSDWLTAVQHGESPSFFLHFGTCGNWKNSREKMAWSERNAGLCKSQNITCICFLDIGVLLDTLS